MANNENDIDGNPMLQIREVDIDPDDPLTSIVNEEFYQRYDALIDAGAYMKGIDNENVAAKLGTNAKGVKGVEKRAAVFIDRDNAKVLQDFGFVWLIWGKI